MTDKLTQGMTAYQDGNYEKAIFLLGQVLEEDPLQVEAKLWLGVSMVAQGEADRAIFLFKRVLKESSDPDICAYALQTLEQLGITIDPPPEIDAALRPVPSREVSFNHVMRDLCMLSDADVEEVIPHLQNYIQDLQQFVQNLKPGFAGSEESLQVLSGLLGLASPRRQAEYKNRFQAFLNAPNRLREQTLGSFVRSVEPG
jgi:tetratricopeptide (TPR) repeat protein